MIVGNIKTEVVNPFHFKTAKELLETKPEDANYCVDGLLPTNGLSILAGKPRAGKTTLARQLAVAVAQGTQFLGRTVQQGSVLYLAIEEKQSEVTRHLQQLGISPADPIFVHCGAVPKNECLEMLIASLKQTNGVALVIIDPLFRFVGVKDSNDYVQVNNTLERLMEVARNCRVHILTVHHMKKKVTEDSIDGALGSTAIVAGCDTFIALHVDGKGIRSILTRQRYGSDMESTQLIWDGRTRELSLGATNEEVAEQSAQMTIDRIIGQMLDYVSTQPLCTQEAILNAVQGKTSLKKQLLQTLYDIQKLKRVGAGVKGEPYLYSVAEIGTESLRTNDVTE